MAEESETITTYVPDLTLLGPAADLPAQSCAGPGPTARPGAPALTEPVSIGRKPLFNLGAVTTEPHAGPDPPGRLGPPRADPGPPREAGRDARRRATTPTPSPCRGRTRCARSATPIRTCPPDTATGDRVGVTGRVIFQRNTGKLCFATLREGDGTELQAMLSLAKRGRRGAGAVEGRGRPGRPRVRRGRGDHQQARGAVGDGGPLGHGEQGRAPAAGRAPRAQRGDPGPAALRRPDRPAAGPRHGAHSCPGGADAALDAARPRFRRGRDADAATAARRGDGAALRHPCECARHRPVPADRPGAVPQAHGRRRHRARLRDQSQLPQRGHRLDALAGVRDARGLSGIRDL